MIIRVYVAAAVLLGIYLAAYGLKDRGMPTEIARPELAIQELPRQLGTWTAEDLALDPEVFKSLGAEMAIDRLYRDKKGNAVSLQSAVFLKNFHRGVQGLIHPPEVCYPAAGYHAVDGETVYLDAEGSPSRSARLLTFEKQGQRICCLYWYQLGGTTYCTGDAQRRLIRGLRGQTTWPPVVKVMLETTAVNPAEAKSQLLALAALAFDWTCKFH
jgi:hypothetical protein